MDDDIAAQMMDAYAKGTNDGFDRELLVAGAQRIEQLQVERDRWQATAAGLSQDISNAEDDIEQLHELAEQLAHTLRLIKADGPSTPGHQVHNIVTDALNIYEKHTRHETGKAPTNGRSANTHVPPEQP